MTKVNPFRYRGHNWDTIRKETNESLLNGGYVIVERPVSYSELKRSGTCVTAIDAKPENLPVRVQAMTRELAKGVK